MSESTRTGVFVTVAAITACLAWLGTAPATSHFQEVETGAPFFPSFTDAALASSIEIVEFDASTSTSRPFKVLNRDGLWTIPSHDNYPADGAERLSSIASSLIALRKEDIAGEAAGEHERFGVLDPLDETLPSSSGRGTRITIRGTNDRVLADLILGSAVRERPALRYARVPGQNRVFVTSTGQLVISTAFGDWIDRNLLQVGREDIDRILIRNYALQAATGQVPQGELTALTRVWPDRWSLEGPEAARSLDTVAMNVLLTSVVDLTILDVLPKPAGVASVLGGSAGDSRLARSDVAELASRGFHITGDRRLLSSQGEVLVHTTEGIFYVLRFGQTALDTSNRLPATVATAAEGTGAASRSSSGASANGVADAGVSVSPPVGGSAHRYLFVSVGFDGSSTSGAMSAEVRARLERLRARFAPWYYIISDESFRKIRASRAALLGAPTSR